MKTEVHRKKMENWKQNNTKKCHIDGIEAQERKERLELKKKNCFIITVKNEKTSHRLGENITKDISDLKKYQKLLKLNNKEKKNFNVQNI